MRPRYRVYMCCLSAIPEDSSTSASYDTLACKAGSWREGRRGTHRLHSYDGARVFAAIFFLRGLEFYPANAFDPSMRYSGTKSSRVFDCPRGRKPDAGIQSNPSKRVGHRNSRWFSFLTFCLSGQVRGLLNPVSSTLSNGVYLFTGCMHFQSTALLLLLAPAEISLVLSPLPSGSVFDTGRCPTKICCITPSFGK